MALSILPKQFEKCSLEEAVGWPGICRGQEPSIGADHVFHHPEEDTRYLIIVHKNTLQIHRSERVFSELERRLKGSVKTKSDSSWTIRDFPVPKLGRMITEFEYGLSRSI
jgi:hypothetical protein